MKRKLYSKFIEEMCFLLKKPVKLNLTGFFYKVIKLFKLQ